MGRQNEGTHVWSHRARHKLVLRCSSLVWLLGVCPRLRSWLQCKEFASLESIHCLRGEKVHRCAHAGRAQTMATFSWPRQTSESVWCMNHALLEASLPTHSTRVLWHFAHVLRQQILCFLQVESPASAPTHSSLDFPQPSFGSPFHVQFAMTGIILV